MGDKMDAYRKAKKEAQSIRRAYDQALGLDRPDNDKHALRIGFGIPRNDFSLMDGEIRLQSVCGYYGDSGCSQPVRDVGAKWLFKAINSDMRRLADLAVEMAELEAKNLLEGARAEAVEILKETEQNGAGES